MALAGLDVGTSGCKMVVFNETGHVLFSAHRSYSEYGQDGIREIDPSEVIASVKETIREVFANTPEPIKAMAVASLGESAICIGHEGESLCRSMVTGDKRGIAEVKELVAEYGSERIMNITGLPPSEMYALPKLMWLNRNTNAIRLAKYIFFYEDFVGYVLTGKRSISYSLASRSMGFDIHSKKWSQFLLDHAGIRSCQLSKPMSSGATIGNILPEIAAELGIAGDVTVAVGGHDQNCAALGGGVLDFAQGEDGHGTCEVMVARLPDNPSTSTMLKLDLPCVPYVLPDSYLTFIEITTCGVLMNWCRDTVLSDIRNRCMQTGEDFFLHMDQQVRLLEPTGLLVLPQFGSAGNPNVDYEAKGTIWGLTVHTGLAEIYRAVKEGMAYQMLLAYDSLMKLGVEYKQIALTGGGSSSEFTSQLRADVFGIPMLMLENKEAGALGCAIMAGVATGVYFGFADGVQKTVRIIKRFVPDMKKHQIYRYHFEKYKHLYNMIYNFK